MLVGWPLERKVHELRTPRNQLTEAYLLQPTEKTEMEARAARKEFSNWHLVSVFLNLATILGVTAAMAMAGNLESGISPEPKKDEDAGEKPVL